LRNKPTTGSHCRKHCIKLNEKEGNEREKLKVLCTIKKIHPFQNNRIRKGTILFIHKSFVTKSSKVFTRIKRAGGQGWGIGVAHRIWLHYYLLNYISIKENAVVIAMTKEQTF